ncbi:hypothetical protein A2634_00485 [Candidatus Amesbacteria bacterium RIFCSPHIGHO2_01_FULL_48_32]|uniref:Uncharacterized protein n=1 Tax=Candidatus Amesbacteria bacterium RIFCSPLOWO2_01_FULL_48_25 TaxID=1797259 RepID=A0A1F4ZCY8_9BACT|nr:MAG: hypothetical protein A2634_00485 [Candidatus Amesbacteria bacterium RIFCSPHIGHO2_01_FULL_48_32]OGD03284.1 MAG: hypothetical protein A2989_00435 [Candidatus Amesbacteria bacterium RIFCSPLOWO2_01_FULL_48_25]HJZ05232.1 hypothetical protein [Patescibacteria group bacterium]
MASEWETLIERLREKQASLPPGHKDLLDISGIIQAILAEPLGGNRGHALYFLRNPDEKENVLANIRASASKLLGETIDSPPS